MNYLPRIAKVALSIILSLVAIIVFLKYKGKRRALCMIAMIICTAADMFMTNFISIGEFNLYVGAGLFILAHLIYGITFCVSSKENAYKYANGGFYFGLSLIIIVIASLAIFNYIISDNPQEIMFYLIIVYVLMIGFNLISQFSFGCSYKNEGYYLIIGMTLFIVSDYLIFLNMLNILPEMNDLVWGTYVPAQLLIIIFNVVSAKNAIK